MGNVEIPQYKSKLSSKKVSKVAIGGIVLLVILLFIAIFCLTFKKTVKLHYSEKSFLNYKVYLKENDYFEKPYVGMNNKYISTLIDYVDADINYKFVSDQPIDVNYSYSIIASIEIKDDNKYLFTKDYTLLEEQEFSPKDTNEFNISENIKFEYEKYNKYVEGFIKKYDLKNTTNELVVRLVVNMNGKENNFNKNISNKSVVMMKLPLTNKTTDIEMTYSLTDNKDEVLQYSEVIISNKFLFSFVIFLSISDIGVIILLLTYIQMTLDYKGKYQAKLKSILKEYGEMIGETTMTRRKEDLEKTKSLKIVEFKNIKSLADTAEVVKKPILFHEEIKGEESIFYLYDDKVCYIYYMKATDFK